MFDIGFWELCVIGVVLLLVLGPERMPEVARQIGYWVGRTRRTVNSLRAEMKREIDAIPTNEITQAAKLANEGFGEIKAEMTELNKGLKEKVGAVTSQVEDVANTRLDSEPDTGDGNRETIGDGDPDGDQGNAAEVAAVAEPPESEKSS
jgi:sec-independent protein translocase protein TatB